MSLWERIRAWCGDRIQRYTMTSYREAIEAMKKETSALPATPDVRLPSVGNTVLFTAPDGLTWPAIVIEIDAMQPTVLALTVFAITGPAIVDVVRYDESSALSTWRWPDFVRRAS